MITRHVLALVTTLVLAAPAQAERQYGIEVQPDELSFMLAQHAAATRRELGRAGPPDYAGAAELYRRAAVLGYPLSQNRLGLLYERGLGVTQDFVTAYVWYALAARHGNENALANRDDAARKLSASEVVDAQARARRLLEQLPRTH